MGEDGGRGEGLLEGCEGSNRRRSPGKLDGFASKGSQGGSDGGIVVDDFFCRSWRTLESSARP